MKKELNDLFDYGLSIYQIKEFFKFSLDSILLAEYVNIKDNSLVLDLCTGNGSIPLILSTKVNNQIIGFENQKIIADLAKESIAYNQKEKQITIINDDVNNIFNYYKSESFNTIICNPPFFKYSDKALVNENEVLAKARHEITIDLSQIFKIVNKMLISNGSFYLIHRPERIDDIICLARENNLNVKNVQLITTNNNLPRMILVKCVKNSKTGVKISKIINVNNLKTYKNIFKEEK